MLVRHRGAKLFRWAACRGKEVNFVHFVNTKGKKTTRILTEDTERTKRNAKERKVGGGEKGQKNFVTRTDPCQTSPRRHELGEKDALNHT